MRGYRLGTPVVLVAISFGLGGCGIAGDLFGGGNKQAPDEFQVVAQQPLSIPPNADLRPPRPGAPRPQDTAPQVQARAIVTGGPVPPPGTVMASGTESQSEVALLTKAGATGADPNIRNTVNEESRILAENDRSFIDTLIFWRKTPEPGTVVDPAKEQQRIQQTQAVGQSVTTGATPVIERRKRGILEGIF
jgi:hypothetical protein